MKRLFYPLAALAAVALVPVASSAHHSTAMFEWGKEVPLKNAKVVRWEWTNPHTFLYVTTDGPNGAVKKWAFEGMSPNHLTRAGWSKRSLKPGDVVDLTYYPLRDGRSGGFNVTVTFPDGHKLNQLQFD
ncbi:DUF6152 family protein [Altererythrobacter sp. B11]|uniref:DUF6152 family protein n=1 Tax=Altererythrobacter sp. B11 TaxID=2060312 RepID=UPI0011AE8764|nr:DUF6152 family protein [Altererythrobacter sp. B11]